MARLIVRLLSIALLFAGLSMFIAEAQDPATYLSRSMFCMALGFAAPAIAIVRNSGNWLAPNLAFSLGAWFFAAVIGGLNVYVHSLWFYDIGGIKSDATQPGILFQFLPFYTVFAGAIGFAIGAIIGSNVLRHRKKRAGKPGV